MERWTQAAADSDAWVARDLALLTSDDGWRAVRTRGDFSLWSRREPDDGNLLFRWRLAQVGAPAEVVFEGFMRRVLEYHRRWTREFTDGRLVEQLDGRTRVLYQRFDPGIPGIAKRDLCSAEAVRELAPGRLLASFRSVDRMPHEPGFARIDWWGAALAATRPDGRTSELLYLDRENQGGRLPAWFVNLTMPQYLTLQGEAVRAFFADGGPPELRAPR
ncbi:MAG: START domain-containing protein [Polyangiales bacterium]